MTPDPSIRRVSLTEALDTQTIRQEIERIAGENYRNAPLLLEQEYYKNNQVYLYSVDGKVQGFFMVGWSRIGLEDDGFDSVFLGLSSVSPQFKGQKIGGSLYRAFVADAQQWQVAEQREAICWFHTASSVVAQAWWKITDQIVPQPDGQCSGDLLTKLERIKSEYGMKYFASLEYPFLLRGYAKARYSSDETDRLNQLREGREDDLLSTLNVNEANGDRLLFVSRIPQAKR